VSVEDRSAMWHTILIDLASRRPKVSSFSVPGSCTATRRSGVLALRDGGFVGCAEPGVGT
jgi:hypothetical protein